MSDLKFIIAGDSNAKVFKSAGLDVPQNVRLIGYVSDEELMVLYRHASVFVYPSLYEGFGIPPLEAMMCGCPVVVSDIEVFHEVYGDSVEYCDFKDERLWMRVLKEVIEYTNCKKIDSDIICNKYNWNKTVYILQNVILVNELFMRR